MGLDELKDKVQGAGTEQASDAGIEKAGDAVDAKTGGKGTEQVDKVEDVADSKIGQ